MAIKLISLRDFLGEISSSLATASLRLAGPQETGEPEPVIYPSTGLGIRYVKVSFSARVTNRRLTNTKPVRRDEIMLDFTQDSRKSIDNIYAEVLFTGQGEQIDYTRVEQEMQRRMQPPDLPGPEYDSFAPEPDEDDEKQALKGAEKWELANNSQGWT